jgi:predicted flap endonuclease-1-like 5' DNA nuclease
MTTNRGPLVKVRIGPNRYAKMYQKDAIERGLVKSIKPVENKMILPAENKADWEDFTDIPGIGKASNDLLHEHGVHSYEDLLRADISYLNGKSKAAVEAWREALGA